MLGVVRDETACKLSTQEGCETLLHSLVKLLLPTLMGVVV